MSNMKSSVLVDSLMMAFQCQNT